MLVIRYWTTRGNYRPVRWKGWFLLGLVPLFVRQESYDEK